MSPSFIHHFHRRNGWIILMMVENVGKCRKKRNYDHHKTSDEWWFMIMRMEVLMIFIMLYNVFWWIMILEINITICYTVLFFELWFMIMRMGLVNDNIGERNWSPCEHLDFSCSWFGDEMGWPGKSIFCENMTERKETMYTSMGLESNINWNHVENNGSIRFWPLVNGQ